MGVGGGGGEVPTDIIQINKMRDFRFTQTSKKTQQTHKLIKIITSLSEV